MKLLTALSLTALFLAGNQFAFAKTVKAKPEVIAAITTVRIADEVPMPKDMFFQGRAQSIGMGVGGAVGGIISESMPKEPPAQIAHTMRQNQIDLPTIVKAEFAKALQNAGPIAVVEGTESPAKIDLKVEMYGFGQTQGFSSVLYPVLRVEAVLTDGNGAVVWQNSDYISPLNKENTVGHTFEEFVNQPEFLRETWTNIAGIVSRLVVKSLYPPVKKKK